MADMRSTHVIINRGSEQGMISVAEYTALRGKTKSAYI
jgi:hypothetical protein